MVLKKVTRFTHDNKVYNTIDIISQLSHKIIGHLSRFLLSMSRRYTRIQLYTRHLFYAEIMFFPVYRVIFRFCGPQNIMRGKKCHKFSITVPAQLMFTHGICTGEVDV